MKNYATGTKTKNNITAAATVLFYKKGYQQVTVKEICALLDIPDSLFYHYYKSKADLMLQIYDRANDALDQVCMDIENTIVSAFDIVKPLVYFGLIYQAILEDRNMLRLYAELLMAFPRILTSDVNTCRLEKFFSALDLGITKGKFELLGCYIASSAHMILYRYLLEESELSDKEFLYYLIKAPLTLIAPDNVEMDPAVRESMEIIDAHHLDLGKIFLQTV